MADGKSNATRIYSVYTLFISFIIPVSLVSIFYTILVVKLQKRRQPGSGNQRHVIAATGDSNRGAGQPPETQPQHGVAVRKLRSRKVTWLVTTVVVVYIACWLPYWIFQVQLISYVEHAGGRPMQLPTWMVFMFQLFTVLSYANSAVNPFLYAFTNEQFRHSCPTAFLCRLLPPLPSVCPPSTKTRPVSTALVVRRSEHPAAAAITPVDVELVVNGGGRTVDSRVVIAVAR